MNSETAVVDSKKKSTSGLSAYPLTAPNWVVVGHSEETFGNFTYNYSGNVMATGSSGSITYSATEENYYIPSVGLTAISVHSGYSFGHAFADEIHSVIAKYLPQFHFIERDAYDFLYTHKNLIPALNRLMRYIGFAVKGNHERGLKVLKYDDSFRSTLFIIISLRYDLNDPLKIYDQLTEVLNKLFGRESSFVNISIYPLEQV